LIIIGIDPGISGGIAVLGPGGACSVSPMPVVEFQKISTRTKSGFTKQHDMDGPSICKVLNSVKHIGIAMVGLERVHAWKGQGVVSVATFMEGYGVLKGILTALEIPYTLIEPTRWKHAMLADMGKGKSASIARAKQLFPGLEIDGDGPAEALLIAQFTSLVYGRN
jgi:crossover junction endodeoxyribonuclease RuvC